MLHRRDLLSILVTFAMGFVAGVYLYLVGFAPQVEEFKDQLPAPQDSLEIIGEQYGGFRSLTSPSFQITNENSYRFIASAPVGVVVEPRSGAIPATWRQSLRPYLTAEVLAVAAEPRTGECVSDRDGIDYRYRITIKGEVYQLDTCKTNLLDNIGLSAALANLWSYFVVNE